MNQVLLKKLDSISMKVLFIIIFSLSFSPLALTQENKIIKAQEAQFGSNLDLRPYKVQFKRDGKQYSVDLPFKVSDQTMHKLLKLADVNKPRGYMDEMDVDDLYRQHVVGDDRDKYFSGDVKQWGQLSESEQENFKKNIMPTMKEYYAPLEPVSFSEVMEMLINKANQKECNCVDINGVKIKTCE